MIKNNLIFSNLRGRVFLRKLQANLRSRDLLRKLVFLSKIACKIIKIIELVLFLFKKKKEKKVRGSGGNRTQNLSTTIPPL